MGLGREVESFIETYVSLLENGTAAIFAGAGLSCSAGLKDWRKLLERVAEELRLNISLETDLVALAQYYHNKKKRTGLNQIIKNAFGANTQPSENHKILAKLPIKTYWTTNYDSLIEKSFENCGKTIDVKRKNEDLTTVIQRSDAVIYKMHGDITSIDDTVITKDEYETYSYKREPFRNALKYDLLSKTFLFIGFSFEDPNLLHILGTIKILLQDSMKEHYCIMKKVSRDDFCSGNSELDEKNCQYEQIKRELRIEDLQKRYSINVLEVDEYSDVTAILQEIERRFRTKRVFISGSLVDAKPYMQKEVEDFVFQLSKDIVRSEYQIISGFGIGIGGALINGVLEYVYDETKYRHIDERLILWPFPQSIEDEEEKRNKFTKYREDMLSEAGVAIFMFGNKLSQKESTIVEADGVLEEYNIAKKRGVKVIAIGCTGGAAKKIWEEQMAEFETYFPSASYPGLQSLYEKLGEKDLSLEKCRKLVLEILDIIAGRCQSK